MPAEDYSIAMPPENDKVELSALAQRISTRLQELSLRPTTASRLAGLSSSGIRNILEGKSHSPRGETLTALARVLGTTEEWLLHGSRKLTLGREKGAEVFVRSEGTSFAVFGSRGFRYGNFILDRTPTTFVQRPWFVAESGGCFGIVFRSDGMRPEIVSGDLLIVDPESEPSHGLTCCFAQEASGREGEMTVRHLVEITSDGWLARRWSPEDDSPDIAEDELLPRANWQRCMPIVARVALR